MAGDATGNRMNEMFDKFWSEYPRRAKKADARKAFAKAISLVEFATMIQGAQRYAQEVSGRAMRYIMLPGTWLRGECWDDEAGANDDSRVYSVVKVAMSEDEKAVYALGAVPLGYHIEWAGVTMLAALGVAMAIMFYVLIAGSAKD